VGAGAIDRAGLAQALAAQHTDRARRRIGEIIVDLGLTTEERIREALSKVLAMPVVNLDVELPEADAVAAVGREVAVAGMILPLRIERAGTRRTLVIGMADPTDLQAVDKLQFKLGMAIRPLLATSSQLRRGIQRAYGELPGTPAAAPAPTLPAVTAPPAWAGRTPPMVSVPAAVVPAAPSEGTAVPRTPATAGHPDVNVELRVIGGPRDGLRVPLPPSRSPCARGASRPAISRSRSRSRSTAAA